MADYADKPQPKAKPSDEDDVIKTARDRWDRAYEKERDNIDAAYEDLQFLSGSQWPAEIAQERENDSRPVLTVNRLPQFVHQITGDIRQMKPAIKAVPVDDAADEQVAGLLGGLIRYIENRSDATGVYFQAADQQVPAGIGHWRVLTEYADDSTFEQEIRIASVDDGISVLWDPDAKRLTREDGQYCFVPFDFNAKAFKEKYPDADSAGFETLNNWANLGDWYSDDHVRVCEYWVKKPIKRTLALTVDGKVLDLTDEDKEQQALAKSMGARIEQRDSYKVCRYLITACEVLEGPTEWPGRYIPIVPVLGEETRIGRKTIRNGIVRWAKDPQRMYNYARSSQTEVIALQPKAPFMVTETNVSKYQDVWENANAKNYPYLPYEPDSKNGGQAPQRIPPPVSSQGIDEAVALAAEDLKAVTGIYDASLGARSNETSGKAIIARQREGDVGSYVYIDNFARAIRHTGKILVDLIPHIYDTQRTIRIMGEDGRIDLIKINQAQAEAGQQGITTKIVNDVTVGSYDVVTEVGPSYTTKREEAKEGMLEFMRGMPQAAPILVDLVAEAQDWPLKDRIAKRARATIPPNILMAEELEEQGASPEEVKAALQQAQQPPPDPKVMQMQAQLEMDQQRMAFEQQAKQAEMAMKERQAELDAQLAREKLSAEIELKRTEMVMKDQLERERMAREMAIREMEMNANAAAKREEMAQRGEIERERSKQQAKKPAAKSN
jgi:hypothetical protein